MKFTQRQINILRYLNEYRETTIKQLSTKIGVTSQTVKTEILALENILQAYQVTILFQSGKGLKVKGGSHLQELLKIAETNVEFPISDQIMLLLILNREYLVLQEIADKLFISKSQVEKLMPSIMKAYEGEIYSVRHYGYIYKGREINRRNLFVKLIAPYMSGTDIIERFELFDREYFSIKSYFSEKIIEEAYEILKYICNLQNFAFTDEGIKQLFTYLIFILKSNQEDRLTVMGEELLVGIKSVAEFKLYSERVEAMDHTLNLELREEEKEYLAYLFMTLKKKRVMNKEEILQEMKPFIERLLERIRVKFCIDLTADEHLIEGLSYHIYTTLLLCNTKQYTLESNTWFEIKRHYPLGYEMGILAVEAIKETYCYDMDEQELGYLAMHFQAAIEKLKQAEQRIRALIVCHFGMAACNLISRRIERFFPQIDIVGTYSVQEFIGKSEIQCDLIISTESLSNIQIPTLYVTPALKEVELEQVREFVRVRNTKYFITQEIEQAMLFDFEGSKTKEEIIKVMVEGLYVEGYVDEQYLDSIYERETVSSTALQDIAVPHGNPKYVHQMKLAIARVRPYVKWEDEEVKYVFILAVTGELLQHNSRVFTHFYKKISDLEFEINLAELLDKDDESFRSTLLKLFQ